MSEQKSKLGILLLREIFGDVVGALGPYLTSNRYVMLHEMRDKPRAVEAMAVLIQHHCVTFEESKRPGVPRYSINLEQVFNLLKYPRYLFTAKNLFGDTAELMLEELLKSGKITASEIIFQTLKRLPDSSQINAKELQQVLSEAAEKRFISRVPTIDLLADSSQIPVFSKEQDNPFKKPDLNLSVIAEAVKQDSRDLLKGKDGVQWKLNFERFHEEFRNQVIVSSVTRRIDASAGSLVRIIINLMVKSSSVSMVDINEQVDESKDGTLIRYKDQYIKVLEEDRTRFMDKIGNEGGGVYTVNFKNISTQLAAAVIENIVMEKFSSNALRIFRSVLFNYTGLK